MKYEALSDQPVVEATRFLMRPLRQSDAGLLAMHTGDERVARMTRSIPHPLPPGATEAFIALCQSKARTGDFWVLDGSASGHAEVIGTIGLKPIDRNQFEIGYWVAPAFWNAGIASEAVKAMVAANPLAPKRFLAKFFGTTLLRHGS